MEKRLIIGCLMLVFSFSALAGKKVAVVKMLRGEVNVLTLGKTSKLNVNDQVEDGSVIKTGERSFVKIVFTDQSQMNIGPVSEMKIEKFSGEDSGVIDLVKGKIRSQVTKDYLQMKDKDKSKLFIKTPNAVMGVRGTDFMISTNGQSTSTVLFEGEIVFNKLSDVREVSSDRLESIVDAGVRIHPGEFSVVEMSRPEPTIPSTLNVQQLEVLEKNQNFDSSRAPQAANEEISKTSVVPTGLSGQAVSNDPESLKKEVGQVVASESKSAAGNSNAEGYVQGDKVKPANGSFVHIESGVIIPPGPGSVLDKNTNSYIPSTEMGKVGEDGSYVPPKNVEITSDGKILVAVKDASGSQVIKEISAPAPVISASNSVPLGKMPEIFSKDPDLLKPGSAPFNNPHFNPQFAPNGLNDQRNTQINSASGAISPSEAAQRAASPNTRTTIQVNPPTGTQGGD